MPLDLTIGCLGIDNPKCSALSLLLLLLALTFRFGSALFRHTTWTHDAPPRQIDFIAHPSRCVPKAAAPYNPKESDCQAGLGDAQMGQDLSGMLSVILRVEIIGVAACPSVQGGSAAPQRLAERTIHL